MKALKKFSIMDDKIYKKYIRSTVEKPGFFHNLIDEIQCIKNDLEENYSCDELKLIKAHSTSMENALKDSTLFAVIITFLLGILAIIFKHFLEINAITVFICYLFLMSIIFAWMLTRRHKVMLSTTLIKEVIDICLKKQEENRE